ncbi:MAG: hypothetical protein ACE362_08375 [Phaeodactylibacter xiamenensis]|uniref:Uncharacterized protein n=1 Tax=Phaeodactylibacter xiamenensis TaxID=1524460 RepID=A0A098SC22_9BACT|nr:hypothetical protein [Phaeodactylibacter xiamenensis]KGE88587.1 hypothetical protein IX84_07875 [Phaeodactylibacter xiamenensis]
MEEESRFLESLQNLVNVLVNERRTVHYLIDRVDPSENRKAGSRSQRYTFQCLNCQEIVSKKARAKYCDPLCRKQAERKREKALTFFISHQEELVPVIKQLANEVLLCRDKRPADSFKEKQKLP